MKTTECARGRSATLAVLSVVLGMGSALIAQVPDSSNVAPQISAVDLQKLTSSDEGERRIAFLRLKSHLDDPRVAAEVRRLLVIESDQRLKENERFLATKVPPPPREEMGVYYADLAEAAASI